MMRLMERFKCSNCGRLLLMLEVNALQADKLLEIKCPHCNRFNSVLGKKIPDSIPPHDEMLQEMNQALVDHVANKSKLVEATKSS